VKRHWAITVPEYENESGPSIFVYGLIRWKASAEPAGTESPRGGADARMAKSADAADLKSAGRKAVGVQVPLWAPLNSFRFNRLHKSLRDPFGSTFFECADCA
jgi:hypothetical protein